MKQRHRGIFGWLRRGLLARTIAAGLIFYTGIGPAQASNWYAESVLFTSPTSALPAGEQAFPNLASVFDVTGLDSEGHATYTFYQKEPHLFAIAGDSKNYCGPTSSAISNRVFGKIPQWSRTPSLAEDTHSSAGRVGVASRSGEDRYDAVKSYIDGEDTNSWDLNDSFTDGRQVDFVSTFLDLIAEQCSSWSIPGIGGLVCEAVVGFVATLGAVFGVDLSGSPPWNVADVMDPVTRSSLLAGAVPTTQTRVTYGSLLPHTTTNEIVSRLTAERATEALYASSDLSKYGYIARRPINVLYVQLDFYRHFCLDPSEDFDCISLSEIKAMHWVSIVGYDLTHPAYPLVVQDPGSHRWHARLTPIPSATETVGGDMALEYEEEALTGREYRVVFNLLDNTLQRSGGVAQCNDPCMLQTKGASSSCVFNPAKVDEKATMGLIASNVPACTGACGDPLSAGCRSCLDVELKALWESTARSVLDCVEPTRYTAGFCYGAISEGMCYYTWCIDQCEPYMSAEDLQSGAYLDRQCGAGSAQLEQRYQDLIPIVRSYLLLTGKVSCTLPRAQLTYPGKF